METKNYQMQGFTFTQSVLSASQQIDLMKLFKDENVVLKLFGRLNDYVRVLAQREQEKYQALSKMAGNEEEFTKEYAKLQATQNGFSELDYIMGQMLKALPELGDGCEDLLFNWMAIILNTNNENFYMKDSKYFGVPATNHINKKYDVWIPFLKANLDDVTVTEVIRDFFQLEAKSNLTNSILGLLKQFPISKYLQNTFKKTTDQNG